MDLLTIILVLGLLLAFAVIGYFILKAKESPFDIPKVLEENALLKAKTEELMRDIGELKTTKEALDERKGEIIRLEKQYEGLKNQNEQYLDRLKGAGKKIAEFEAREEQRNKDKSLAVDKASEMRDSFEEQKKRLLEKEEMRLEKQKSERNRIWNDHEAQTVTTLRSICRKPEVDFKHYDNNDLPAGFDGKFKPDFMLEFLGQYIVFDAKMNDPDSNNSLENYLKAQVKSTADKIKKSNTAEEIYNTVYLVVPASELGELNTLSYVEQNLNFFIISEESLEPIIQSYKKITYYEQIESIDPKERENIINVIATLDYELSYQNAVNVLLTARGVNSSKAIEILDEETVSAIEKTKSNKRLENFKPTDLKRLVNDPNAQVTELKKVIQPKASLVSNEAIQKAQDSLL